MIEVCGVQFIEGGKVYYFSTNKKEIKENDYVIVETEKGMQMAKVILKPQKIDKHKYKNLKKIIRFADEEDLKINEENIKEAGEALKRAEKIAAKQKLQMKFLSASYTFDKNQLFLTFVSENRVDFRSLAKELAGIYRTRIELRQIGIRDKAKEVSGIGQCGRQLCCSSFLNNIDSVSIGMVKNQKLSLNPTKINGQCGRLLCCLKYENEMYVDYMKKLPKVGDRVTNGKTKGIVTNVNILDQSYTINTENDEKKIIKVKS